MNLILIILRMLWAIPRRGAAQLQLVPTTTSRRAAGSSRQWNVPCVWIPGLGWLSFHPLFRRREDGFCRFQVNRWVKCCYRVLRGLGAKRRQ